MALDQPLETTTHVVSHLLREIESAMRGVLAPMIEGVKEAWQISHWRDAPRKILQAAKQNSDVTVLEAVDDVVNRLGARGLFEFRDLLS